jgi:NAD(P)-dependent dehydrogenase (short-subunit alcohol dehydrogenase family)
MNKLKGKVIIITGSSRGIGMTIAKTLAKNGAKVVVNLYNEVRLHLSLDYKTPNMVYKLSA